MSKFNLGLLIAALAILGVEIGVIWLLEPRRLSFSIRTLLIAMAIASALLGLIAIAS